MDRKGIASAGNLIVDYIKTVDSYPKQGNLSSILSINKAAGGAPVNCLVDLAIMDNDLKLQAIGVVGNDEDGEYLLNIFKNHNIDSSLIYKEDGCKTSFTDVITIEATGERTFFQYRGANSILGFEHFDFSKINAEILHVGYALLLDKMDSADEQYGTVMARALAEAQKYNIKTSFDTVSENSERFSRIIPPSLKFTNYCIINEVEASMITGIPAMDGECICADNMKRICIKLFELGVNDLVVIHAPEAAFGMNNRGTFYYRPSLNIPKGYIKGKVGAGDAFCAGILYSIYKGWELGHAIEIAIAAATCSLSELNATDGMRNIDTICEMARTMQ